jgi:hypothetical protein
MKELHSEIEIQASADRVWQLLTDFSSFPQWTLLSVEPVETPIWGKNSK